MKKLNLFILLFIAACGNVVYAQRTININDENTSTSQLRQSSVQVVEHESFGRAKNSRSFNFNPQLKTLTKNNRGDRLQLDFFDDRQFTGLITDVTHYGNDAIGITAKIEESDFGFCHIAITEHGISISADLPESDESFMAMKQGTGTYLSRFSSSEMQKKALPGAPPVLPEEKIIDNATGLRSAALRGFTPGTETLPASLFACGNIDMDSHVTITVLVPYTAAARQYATNNLTSIDNAIILAFQIANLVSSNSELNITFEVAHKYETDYVEMPFASPSSLYFMRRTDDGYMDEVHDLRKQYHADMVMAFMEISDVGGIGYVMLDEKGDVGNFPFAISRIQQVTLGYTMIHEIGHNMGAGHHEAQGDRGLYSYSYGWRGTNDKGRFSTVMTYESFDEQGFFPHIPYFSDPNKIVDGAPTGAANADVVQTFKRTKLLTSLYSDILNTSLSNITHDAGALGTLIPSFNPDITEYLLQVDDNVKNISVTGITDCACATVEGNVNNMTLSPDGNTITIAAKALDGSIRRKYTVNVKYNCMSIASDPAFAGDVSAQQGNESLNLNLGAPIAIIERASLKVLAAGNQHVEVIIMRKSETDPSCSPLSGYFGVGRDFRFRVTTTGNYGFAIPNTGFPVIATILHNSEILSCDNFVYSNGYRLEEISPDASSTISFMTVELTAGTDYHLKVHYIISGMEWNFSVTPPPGGKVVSVESLPPYIGYTYVAVSQNDNLIKHQSVTGDFRTLTEGDYKIYSLTYVLGTDPNGFIGNTLSSLKCVTPSAASINMTVTEPDKRPDWERLNEAINDYSAPVITIYKKSSGETEDLSQGKLVLAENEDFINSNGTPINISRNLTIKSPNKNNAITIYAATGRHFTVGTSTLVFNKVILDGKSTGGGITTNAGTTANIFGVLIQNCRFTGNGGAILANGALALNSSTLANNVATVNGGGMSSSAGLTVINCTFYNNMAVGGGAIYTTAAYSIRFSTFNANKATAANNAGTAIHSTCDWKDLLLTGNLIYGNTGNSSLSEVYNSSGGNSANALISYNIIRGLSLGTNCLNIGLSAANTNNLFANVVDAATGVAVLADNGGSTPTILIKQSGVAYNYIPAAVAAPWGVTTDQRGENRPSGEAYDAGSIELKIINTLVWTGKSGKDWNNPANWGKPANEGGGAAGLPPGFSTDVRIPADLTSYPDLTPGITNYTQEGYSTAACNDIYFEHGGEVVRTDLLTYRKAYVELRLPPDRWYMTSAPLRYMFPGDYWVENLCPKADGLRVFTQLFVTDNPQQKNMNMTGDWTGPFNNPEIKMPAGFGFGVWLDDQYNYPSPEITRPRDADGRHTMWFPKQEFEYPIFRKNSCDVVETRSLTRTTDIINDNLHHRFIYEQNNEPITASVKGSIESNGDIYLTTEQPGGVGGGSAFNPELGEYGWLIVGNPFMSHWNFKRFADRNPEINDVYWVLGSANSSVYETHSPRLGIGHYNNMQVAPMQSVITSAIVPDFTNVVLKANVTDMEQRPGDKLRSASEEVPSDLLRVLVEKDGIQNMTYIVFEAQATNNYKVREDSYKLFVTSVTDAVSVYTRSSDEVALDINVFGEKKEIPLGVRTETTGEITLNFEGVETFVPEEDLILVDKETGEMVDLRKTPFYTFEKTTDELFMDNRLFILFDGITGTQFTEQGVISIFMQGNQLKVTSSDNIKQVQIIDMQGRMLLNETNINDRAYTRYLNAHGMYVVKVSTDRESVVKKVTTSNN